MQSIPFCDLIASPLGFGAGVIGYILLGIIITGIAAKVGERDA